MSKEKKEDVIDNINAKVENDGVQKKVGLGIRLFSLIIGVMIFIWGLGTFLVNILYWIFSARFSVNSSFVYGFRMGIIMIGIATIIIILGNKKN